MYKFRRLWGSLRDRKQLQHGELLPEADKRKPYWLIRGLGKFQMQFPCTVNAISNASTTYSIGPKAPPSSLTLLQAVEIPFAEAQNSTIRGIGQSEFFALE
jgi:hypothetical protein